MSKGIKTENFERIEISNRAELNNWLEKNHASDQSFWLVTYKKSVPEKYVSTSEILDELISYGWIDGIRRKLDEHKTMQLISQRKTQHWAKTYKDRAERLIREGRMKSHGLRSIDRSKQLGLWDFMDDVDRLEIPTDLKVALESKRGAKSFFDQINPSSKRFALRWLKLAKKNETRKKRILKIAELAAKGEKLPGS